MDELVVLTNIELKYGVRDWYVIPRYNFRRIFASCGEVRNDNGKWYRI